MTFTASNGARYSEQPHGGIRFMGGILDPDVELSAGMAFGIREFFQHERDEELGRWRWPENPTCIVKEGESTGDFGRGRTVYVFHEATFDRFHFNERVRSVDDGTSIAHQAARAYFEAHPDPDPDPEPKPWHEAQVVTWRDGAYMPQIAQRDMGRMGLGWLHGKDEDARWYSEDGLAQQIGDADVTILIPKEES